MRRRIESRWRLNETEIARLRARQLDLLKRAALLLKPGGNLIYSTCSLEAEENQQVIQSFVSQEPAVALLRTRELLPWVEGTDGAFVATLRRS